MLEATFPGSGEFANHLTDTPDASLRDLPGLSEWDCFCHIGESTEELCGNHALFQPYPHVLQDVTTKYLLSSPGNLRRENQSGLCTRMAQSRGEWHSWTHPNL